MSINLPKPPSYLLRDFQGARIRYPYGAELFNVVESIRFTAHREKLAANQFEPMIFPVTRRTA